MRNTFLHPEFYVRKCYPYYYNWILRKLSRRYKIVSVTGTAGKRFALGSGSARHNISLSQPCFLVW